VTEEEIKKEDEQVYSFLTMLTVAPLLLSKGAAFYLLYKWFILALSHYPIGFWQITGLTLCATLLQQAFKGPLKDIPAKKVFNRSWSAIGGYWVTVLLGLLIHWMMGR